MRQCAGVWVTCIISEEVWAWMMASAFDLISFIAINVQDRSQARKHTVHNRFWYLLHLRKRHLNYTEVQSFLKAERLVHTGVVCHADQEGWNLELKELFSSYQQKHLHRTATMQLIFGFEDSGSEYKEKEGKETGALEEMKNDEVVVLKFLFYHVIGKFIQTQVWEQIQGCELVSMFIDEARDSGRKQVQMVLSMWRHKVTRNTRHQSECAEDLQVGKKTELQLCQWEETQSKRKAFLTNLWFFDSSSEKVGKSHVAGFMCQQVRISAFRLMNLCIEIYIYGSISPSRGPFVTHTSKLSFVLKNDGWYKFHTSFWRDCFYLSEIEWDRGVVHFFPYYFKWNS